MDDTAELVIEERTVLEKFDGDPGEGRLVERITIVDGETVAHEYFTPDDPQEQ